MKKNIDFDRVAKFYDYYVQQDFDIAFWQHEGTLAKGSILELMCGTGRISLPLLRAGHSLFGLDYNKKMLDIFNKKLLSENLTAQLIHADARFFSFNTKFALIFIGFHSLSEVLLNEDKLLIFCNVATHLQSDGVFCFSLHNPPYRRKTIDSKSNSEYCFPIGDKGDKLFFSYHFVLDSQSSIGQGQQFYVVKNSQGDVIDQETLDVKFHLVSQEEIEILLNRAGMQIKDLFGNYDRSPFSDHSPYLIYRCVLK